VASSSTDKQTTEAQALLRAAQRRREDATRQAATMGVWVIGDPKYAGWVVDRVGVKGDPRAEDRYRQILAEGVWLPAPAGTRCGLYANDGDRGLYVITHPEALAELHAQLREDIAAKLARATGSPMSEILSGLVGRGAEVRGTVRRETTFLTAEA